MAELTRDPVCGMDIGTHEAIASATSERRRFYFCCLGCHAAFLDTPHRYVGWAGYPRRPVGSGVAGGRRSSFESCHVAS